jgi:hypothetical protein
VPIHKLVRLKVRQETVGAHQIMRLAAGQAKANRVAQRIGGGVDFGAQSAAGSSDGLIRGGFFWAPALC